MLCSAETFSSPLSLPQVLESNRNQIESKGIQLAANKEQLQTVCQQLEGRGDEIQALQRRIAEMEQQMATSLKGLLLENATNGPVSPTTTSSHSSKVHPLSLSSWSPDEYSMSGSFHLSMALLYHRHMNTSQ